MTRAALIVVVILWPLAASAAAITDYTTITFGTAPSIAATRDCSGGPVGRLAPLELLDEGGLRVRLNNPIGAQNQYPCDPIATVIPPGAGGGWHPLDLATGLRPMTIWYMDAGTVSVESLLGDAILGLTVTSTDRSFVHADRCDARLSTDTGGTFNICQGLNQVLWFADYGLTNVHKFSMIFELDSVGDPNLQLLAVTVPEPSALMLLGLGLAARRRRALSVAKGM